MRLNRFLALAFLSAGALAYAQSSSTPTPSPSVSLPSLNTPAAPDSERTGHTFPSERSEHRLKVPGVVKELLVKPGDRVKAGQLLLKEDHEIEDAQLALYEYIANSTVEIDVAKVKHEQAKVEHERYRGLYNDNRAAAKNEVERAKLEEDLTALEIIKAQQEKEKAAKQVKYQQAVVNAMELRSQINGIVERIEAKLGEVVDPQKNAITIVNNDPLWIEFSPRSSVSQSLQVGQELEVNYVGDKQVRRARIIFISPMVDPRSDRHLIRLEMANPENRPSGLKMEIHLPAKMAQSDAKND